MVGLFMFWYRHGSNDQRSPGWNVVDFQIKDYRTKEEALTNNAGSFNNRDKPNQRQQDSLGQIEELRSRPAFQQQQLSYDELQERIFEFIQWDRPWTDHWPAWHDYDNADYDPNRWEAMDR